jgi:hypothetical protein
MLALRLGLVTAFALCVPISAGEAQQRLPGIFGVFGAIINSAIVDSARREWQSRSVADYNFLATRNISADQLAAQGIGPNDPRIRGLLYACARAQLHLPELSEAQQVAAPSYNSNFVVDGLALGGDVYPDSAIYKSYRCKPSDDFNGFTWCARSRPLGRATSSVSILHSSANSVVLITQTITPAFFAAGDIDREVQRLSRGFGQAQILKAGPHPGLPHAVLAAWGSVTLTLLDEAAMDALRRNEPPHRGLIADFIGDPHKSAQVGLPVYSIGGGPGFLWGASYDDAGKGSLRISAVDASALGPTLPAPTVVVSGVQSPTTPSPEIVPTPPPQMPEQVVQATPNPPSQKAPVKTMDVIDFLVDWKNLKGQTVTVTGCLLRNADTSSVYCSAGPQGDFSIDSNSLAREDFRRALRECAGFERHDDCRADVTGSVTENSIGDAKLEDGAMKWAAPLAAAQSPPSSQQPTASPAENKTSVAMSPAEKSVIDAIVQARHDYEAAQNEMQEGAARPTRAKAHAGSRPAADAFVKARQALVWIGYGRTSAFALSQWQEDGSIDAAFILVGKDGLVPPM